MVLGSGSRVWGSGSRGTGSGSRVWGSGSRVWGLVTRGGACWFGTRSCAPGGCGALGVRFEDLRFGL
jgi:hypothetical protein